MTIPHYDALIQTAKAAAEKEAFADELQHRYDPSPEIAHHLEIAHILSHLPITTLAQLPPFIPPLPPFP